MIVVATAITTAHAFDLDDDRQATALFILASRVICTYFPSSPKQWAERWGEMVTAADLAKMTKEELDALPFGAIRLSAHGTVLSYNATEARLTGRAPGRVLGRNFFRDVAPCTDVKEFHGRFVELFKEPGSLLNEFSFEFPLDPPMRVNITLLRDRSDDSVWALVERADAEPSQAKK